MLDKKVLIVDDLLATGGTIQATIEMVADQQERHKRRSHDRNADEYSSGSGNTHDDCTQHRGAAGIRGVFADANGQYGEQCRQ